VDHGDEIDSKKLNNEMEHVPRVDKGTSLAIFKVDQLLIHMARPAEENCRISPYLELSAQEMGS
jgi:hypothetical protein